MSQVDADGALREILLSLLEAIEGNRDGTIESLDVEFPPGTRRAAYLMLTRAWTSDVTSGKHKRNVCSGRDF